MGAAPWLLGPPGPLQYQEAPGDPGECPLPCAGPHHYVSPVYVVTPLTPLLSHNVTINYQEASQFLLGLVTAPSGHS